MVVLLVVMGVGAVRAEPAGVEARVAALEALTAGLMWDGRTLQVVGNLQLVNGVSGPASCTENNGLGNLVLGRNVDGAVFGSHSLVVGDGHVVFGSCSVAVGEGHVMTAPQAVAMGGAEAFVLAPYGTVVGGQGGRIFADASYGAIVGGQLSEVWAPYGSVSGGYQNRVHGDWGWVGGGNHDEARGILSTAVGGWFARADGARSVAVGSFAEADGADAVAVCQPVVSECRP